jgi:kynureninase
MRALNDHRERSIDSTSVNLFKVLGAALELARADAPERTIIMSERHNFPTDLYIAESLARERGCVVRLVDADAIPAHPYPASL